jgi:hypothetical protein
MAVELTKRQYLLLLESIRMMMKDNFQHHRYMKDDYLERKQMLEDISEEVLRMRGIVNTEDTKQGTLMDEVEKYNSHIRQMDRK